MKPIICLAILVVTSLSGCHALSRFRSPQVQAPVAFHNTPDRLSIIETINANTARIEQLESSVRVSLDGLPALTGNLIAERPRRLRLKAGVLGMTDIGVDIGSNDEQFWIWTKSSLGGATPTLFYASHQDYANSSARRTMRLEPQWILDALGLVEFSAEDEIEGPYPRPDGRIELRMKMRNSSEPMTRVIVVDPKYGWIQQQSIYDAGGQLVAYVNSLKHIYLGEYGASLPQHVEIHVFDPNGQKMKLTVGLTSYSINSSYFDPARTWARPNPIDIQQIDITRIPVQGGMGTGAPAMSGASPSF